MVGTPVKILLLVQSAGGSFRDLSTPADLPAPKFGYLHPTSARTWTSDVYQALRLI